MDDADLDVILRDPGRGGRRPMTACHQLPPQPAQAVAARRLVLVIHTEPARLGEMSAEVSRLAPDAVVLDVTDRTAPMATAGGDGKQPDVILVGADPDGWAAASVLAACRPERLGRPVDALLIAEGPLERFPVLVTDFPGLRLLPPDAEVPTAIARLLRAPRTNFVHGYDA
jgi:hypothetical protein